MMPLQRPAAPGPKPAPKPKRMTVANVKRGPIAVPYFLLLYGEPKIGKSTFAAGAPDPVWIELDNGTHDLNVARYPKPASFAEVLEAVDDAAANGIASGFKTLVIDPLSHLEPLIANDVTGGQIVNTKTWGGGYNAYENAIRDRVRLFFATVERAWLAGLNVILIGHSKVKGFNDPEGPSYDRYELDVESKELSGLTRKSVQAILFAKKEAYGQIDKATKKAKAAGAGAHMLYTIGTPAFTAGNRWSLPPVMPLSYAHFAAAMANGEQRRAELLQQIEAGLEQIGDEAIAATVRGWLKDGRDPAEVHNAVAAKLAELSASTEEQTTETETNETEETNT